MKKLLLTGCLILGINALHSQTKTQIDSLKQVKKDLQLKTKENRLIISAAKKQKQYNELLISINKLQAVETKQKETINKLNTKK